MDKASRTDDEILTTAGRLTALKESLGEHYWRSDEVRDLQQALRRQIGRYGAWGEDSLPMHQRARRAARFESEFAHLLWP